MITRFRFVRPADTGLHYGDTETMKPQYDLIVVGGGMGGAAIATAMATHGADVLVVEREQQFRDRVRGEGMHAWGVPEAKALGIYEALIANCGIEAPYWDMYVGASPLGCRDFTATTPHGSPLCAFYHPAMQETLLALAAQSGADVVRGASIRHVEPGNQPSVRVEHGDWRNEVQARLVVCADGRNSPGRKWGGFTVHEDDNAHLFTGVLVENVTLAEDCWYAVLNPASGQEATLANVGDGRVRAYLGHPRAAGHRFAKLEQFPAFVSASIATGANPDCYRNAKPIGPMATFACADSWVGFPYRDGIALLGDAACTCDPTFGQGMALTLRGARMLRDALTSNDDWHAACQRYAVQLRAEFDTIRTLESWLRTMFLETHEKANAIREAALPALLDDPTRIPDLFGMGPDAPADDRAKQRFFSGAAATPTS